MCKFLQSDNPERICVNVKPQNGVTPGFSPLDFSPKLNALTLITSCDIWDKLGKLHCTIKSPRGAAMNTATQ